MPWYLVVTAVEANTNDRWVVLYVQQWLKAPLQLPDGALQKRTAEATGLDGLTCGG
jgi:RNA-directed DNA polymerase